jgi:hypothetical protein
MSGSTSRFNLPIRGALVGNIDRFLNRRTDLPLVVFEIDMIHPIEVVLLLQSGSNGLQFRLRQQKPGIQRRPPWSLKTDAGGFIPNSVIGTQVFDQHDHVHRVDCGVHAAPEDRAHVIPRLPGKRQFYPYLAPIRCDIGDPRAGAAISRKQVKKPAVETGTP